MCIRDSPETRWGNFWSLGTSWRIDRESFMASTANWLSALTLKMSYGAQGNDKDVYKRQPSDRPRLQAEHSHTVRLILR